MEPFVIEEKEDHVVVSRQPKTEKEEWQVEAALRRVGARMVDELVRKLIEHGHTDEIVWPRRHIGMDYVTRKIAEYHAAMGEKVFIVSKNGIRVLNGKKK